MNRKRDGEARRGPRGDGGRVRRGIVVVVLGVMAVAALGIAPAGATARTTAPAKYSTSDCEALMSISDEIPDVQGSGASYDRRQVAAAATGFKETAKKVDDKELKAALTVLANVYAQLAKSRSAADAILAAGKTGKKFAKAVKVWSTALFECTTADLTLPSLPSNVTLPSPGR